MDDGRSSSAIHWFYSDLLVIRHHHSANPEWSMHPAVHLGELPEMLEDELAGLEVEQERGHFPLVLVTVGQNLYVLL